MLGIGSRFLKSGINTPKYLLDLAQEKVLYFVLFGFRRLNKNKFIFLVRGDHLKYKPKEHIIRICDNLEIKNFETIVINESTKGQADSVRLGLQFCEIDKSLLIFNIDTIHLGLDPDFTFNTEGMIETFEAKGDHWSFAKVDNNNLVENVAEKRRISNNCSNGLYFFKNIKIFKESYFNLYCDNCSSTLNKMNENYIAPMYNDLIRKGMIVINRHVDHRLILPSGVPQEYYLLCSRFTNKKELENKFLDFK